MGFVPYPALPSWLYERDEDDWAGDWRKPDPRWERLQEQYDRDRRQLEDEAAA